MTVIIVVVVVGGIGGGRGGRGREFVAYDLRESVDDCNWFRCFSIFIVVTFAVALRILTIVGAIFVMIVVIVVGWKGSVWIGHGK